MNSLFSEMTEPEPFEVQLFESFDDTDSGVTVVELYRNLIRDGLSHKQVLDELLECEDITHEQWSTWTAIDQ